MTNINDCMDLEENEDIIQRNLVRDLRPMSVYELPSSLLLQIEEETFPTRLSDLRGNLQGRSTYSLSSSVIRRVVEV
jgi:hypothetical protein